MKSLYNKAALAAIQVIKIIMWEAKNVKKELVHQTWHSFFSSCCDYTEVRHTWLVNFAQIRYDSICLQVANGLGHVDELVIFKIFSHMAFQEQVRSMSVCRQWREWLYALTEGCLICQVMLKICCVTILSSEEDFFREGFKQTIVVQAWAFSKSLISGYIDGSCSPWLCVTWCLWQLSWDQIFQSFPEILKSDFSD